MKGKIIDPVQWLAVANERAPSQANAEQWKSGNTYPSSPGQYERHFTDGTFLHYWDGSQWWAEKYTAKKAAKSPIKPHWRQVGDYPCWKSIAQPHEATHS